MGVGYSHSRHLGRAARKSCDTPCRPVVYGLPRGHAWVRLRARLRVRLRARARAPSYMDCHVDAPRALLSALLIERGRVDTRRGGGRSHHLFPPPTPRALEDVLGAARRWCRAARRRGGGGCRRVCRARAILLEGDAAEVTADAKEPRHGGVGGRRRRRGLEGVHDVLPPRRTRAKQLLGSMRAWAREPAA